MPSETIRPMSTQSSDIRGILLLYHRPTLPWEYSYADNVTENIEAFDRFSRFPVWTYNVEYGFPRLLEQLRFETILLHYSVFIPRPNYMLGEQMVEYVESSPAYKVASFQDEHHWCGMRFGFINRVGIDCIYSLLEPEYAQQVYGARTKASTIVSQLPSYVSTELTEAAPRYAKPDDERGIDIGYRGRPMATYMGRGALEKLEIGVRFAELARGTGLVLDIAVSEDDRLYANDWHRFMGDSKGTLGTESGVSCFDLEDEVREEYERLSADGTEPTVEELERGALGRWDGKIPYRTVSPRNFEAAAFRTCQILFEGGYSGLMQPMRHYIPLRKDLSNFDEVIEQFRDRQLRAELTENAHADLIASERYTYERQIEMFDRNLIEAGVVTQASRTYPRVVKRALRRPLRERWSRYRETRLGYLWVHHRLVWAALLPVFHPVKVMFWAGGQVLRVFGFRRGATSSS
jgi:hypothetical protein